MHGKYPNGKWHTLIYVTEGNAVINIISNRIIAMKSKYLFIDKFKIGVG